MGNSFNYNPFAYIYNEDGSVNATYVIKMVTVLMKNTTDNTRKGGDPFWDMAAQTLMTAIAFLLVEQAEIKKKSKDPNWNIEMNFGTVCQKLKFIEAKSKQRGQEPEQETPLDLEFKAVEKANANSMAAGFYKDFKKATPEMSMSIVSICNTRLQTFNIPEVANLTHIDTLELATLGDRKTALFILIPASGCLSMSAVFWTSLRTSAQFRTSIN